MSREYKKPTFEILGIWEGAWDSFEHVLQNGYSAYLLHMQNKAIEEAKNEDK